MSQIGERIRIRSPKTEHHSGKASRTVPIFPELRPYLEEVFEQAAEGSVYVIERYRDKEKNFRTRLGRIIERAGLTPWPKMFQNLRSTRETELAKDHPMHVVCAWIGNSTAIAAKHYLQVTEEDFEKATQQAQQNAQQTASARGDQGTPERRAKSEKRNYSQQETAGGNSKSSGGGIRTPDTRIMIPLL